VALACAIAAAGITLAVLGMRAGPPPAGSDPTVVRTGTPPQPFVTVYPHTPAG
jgi:hypothetical protein